MKKIVQIVFLACGLLLMTAAFPVFAQENKPREIVINKEPVEDFVETVKQKLAAKKIDLSAPFLVRLKGVLNEDGKFDSAKSVYVKSEGNEQMIRIAKDFIEAINASGSFGYLRNLGVEKMTFTLVQDGNQIYADIVSEQETVEKARTSASAFDTFLRMISLMDERKLKRLSEDERILFQGVTANNENKNLTLKFTYQKSVIQEIINRKLKELEQKKG